MTTRLEVTGEERAARKELRAIARELRGLYFRLLGITASLPAREEEIPRESDLDPMDYSEATEMRLAIQCVLRDQIEPAITSLRDAAKLRATTPDEGKR
jgi:hypothetical protein